jgi:hypothetical protein
MEKTSNQTETSTKTLEQKETPTKLTFKEQFETEQKNIVEATTAFDVDDFTQGADTIRTVFVPDIGADGKGRLVRFKRFNAEDGKTLEPYIKASKYEQGLRTLALMLFKADGKTTYDKLKKAPAVEMAAIMQATMGDQKSFRPPKSRKMV